MSGESYAATFAQYKFLIGHHRISVIAFKYYSHFSVINTHYRVYNKMQCKINFYQMSHKDNVFTFETSNFMNNLYMNTF